MAEMKTPESERDSDSSNDDGPAPPVSTTTTTTTAAAMNTFGGGIGEGGGGGFQEMNSRHMSDGIGSSGNIAIGRNDNEYRRNALVMGSDLMDVDEEDADHIDVECQDKTYSVPVYQATTVADIRNFLSTKHQVPLTPSHRLCHTIIKKMPIPKKRSKKDSKRKSKKKRRQPNDSEPSEDEDAQDSDEDENMEVEYDEQEELLWLDDHELVKDILDNSPELLTENSKLQVKWDSFFITVKDGLKVSQELEVSSDFAIEEILNTLSEQYSINIQSLSYNGQEIPTKFTLKQYEITSSTPNVVLVSRISISIADAECGLSNDILVRPFYDLGTVLKTYLDKTRREKHQNALLSRSGQVLSPTDTVHMLGLQNNNELDYRVGGYNIHIYDTDNAQYNSIRQLAKPGSDHNTRGSDAEFKVIEVYDSWTLTEVKQAYSRETKKPFLDDEKLLSDERQLEEGVPLWKLRIRDNEKLVIERQQHDIAVEYVCADCGATVRLKKEDVVACHECLHKIVFKKRTNRVCQYNCR